MDTVLFFAPPLVMCFLLVGIHCYLGLHVLARGVIFVDLALAQVAVFGSTIAFLIGFDHGEGMDYFISLGATLLAALFLAIANRLKQRVSQEALVGVLYAFASGAVILSVDKISHGAEHIKAALTGQLLWVTWADVGKVTVIYSLVALLYFIFRHPLLKSSMKGQGGWLWDFVFYGLFGVVMTSSARVAGVLLVFSFLIVPAVLSSLFVNSMRNRLLFGWGLGFVLSVLGMFISYWLDTPSGAVLVCLFTCLPLLIVVTFGLVQTGSPNISK